MLSTLSEDIFCIENSTAAKIGTIAAVVVGAWKLVFFLIGVLQFLNRHCCRCKQNDLFKRYGRTIRRNQDTGQPCYALVTGGSDGIGLELCNQLAEQGFSVCMLARNLSNMEQKLAALRIKYPCV